MTDTTVSTWEVDNKMSPREIRELKDRVKAMSPEELAIVAETIPVELCLARLHNEIDRAKYLQDTISQLNAAVLERINA